MAYRMIVLDLDGTLTNRDKVITPRTKEALMKLKSQGGTIDLPPDGLPTGLCRWQESWGLQRMAVIFCPLTGEGL